MLNIRRSQKSELEKDGIDVPKLSFSLGEGLADTHQEGGGTNRKVSKMLLVDNKQLVGMAVGAREALKRRVDNWLNKELACWRIRALEERVPVINKVFEFGERAGLVSDLDYALFAKAAASRGGNCEDFLNSPEVIAVIDCTRRRAASKVREVNLFADRLNSAQA